jgi:hypothetical protein
MSPERFVKCESERTLDSPLSSTNNRQSGKVVALQRCLKPSHGIRLGRESCKPYVYTAGYTAK